MSRPFKRLSRALIAALTFSAATLAASAALADNGGTATSNCFHAREWVGWKAPAPNVLLVHVGVNRFFRLDLQQGSDQLKYPDARIINRNMKSAWLCVPTDFQLLLTDGHGVLNQSLIVTSMRQLTPDEVAAIPPKDLP